MTAANGGAETVMGSSRLFLSPGMGHCGGGPAALDNFDMLTAISNWVEKNAHYKGQGDPEDASSYECRR